VGNKTYTTYCFKTRSFVELKDLRKRWYFNNKKIVPMDLTLTPTIVRQWFIGDGTLVKTNIILCTDGFCLEDVLLLKHKLSQLNIESSIYKHRTNQYHIYIKKKSVRIFYSYIGKCPPEIKSIYGYKWRNDGKNAP